MTIRIPSHGQASQWTRRAWTGTGVIIRYAVKANAVMRKLIPTLFILAAGAAAQTVPIPANYQSLYTELQGKVTAANGDALGQRAFIHELFHVAA
jgi:hypothetical protein